ncbi:MAG: phosphatase, partial [Clostridia bacterium]|nr:phosphatase [Clostridia bacterium]
MKYAVIDLGTNTIRLCIYQNTGQERKLLLNQRVLALLGSKTENGALTDEGVRAAADALTLLKAVAKEHGIENVYVFATAALRNISNTEAVAKILTEETGLTIDILSGEEEAELTFLGATETCHVEDGLIADIGGGSTELILVKDGKVVRSESFDIGSLTGFVRFVHNRPAEREHIDALRAYVRSIIREKFPE